MSDTMTRGGRPVRIVLADDDPDDQMFARDALSQSRVTNDLKIVEDGQELLDLLRGEGPYADVEQPALPHLILLDLKMPRMGGFEALTAIKADPRLRHIPVIVMTTSGADEDITHSYDLGVSSFIRKPVTFEGLVEAMRHIGRYWFQIVELPSDSEP